MLVRETTRYRSPFVFDNGAVGLRLPILTTALGLAWVAFCPEKARLVALDLLRHSADPWDAMARNGAEAGRRLRLVRGHGFGYRQGGYSARTSSIGVPVMGQGGAVGAVCVTFATSAVTRRHAAGELLPLLRAAAAEIGDMGTGRGPSAAAPGTLSDRVSAPEV